MIKTPQPARLENARPRIRRPGMPALPMLIVLLPALAQGCAVPSAVPTRVSIPPAVRMAPTPTWTVSPSQTRTPSASPTPAAPGWCSPPGRLPGGFLVVGYLPEYRTFHPQWGNCLTDFIYFSAEPLADGGLDAGSLDPAVFDGMREMKSLYGTRLHLSLGGFRRSDHFGAAVTNPQARRKFIGELLKFAALHSLDGIDFDWEFPSTPSETEGYRTVLAAVREAGYIVSVAIYPDPEFDLTAYRFLDRIHVMSYDRGAYHATYEQAVADLAAFERAGFSRRQLILGIPFYGRRVADAYDEFAYAEIVTTYAPPPESNLVDGIFFNGIDMVRKKTCYARENGFGGVMLWELGQDSSDDTSLLRTAYRAAAGSCPL